MLSAPAAEYLNRVTRAGFPPVDALNRPIKGFEETGQTEIKIEINKSTELQLQGQKREEMQSKLVRITSEAAAALLKHLADYSSLRVPAVEHVHLVADNPTAYRFVFCPLDYTFAILLLKKRL